MNNEGLITSYDVHLCESYMTKRFPNIKKIVSLDYNPNSHHNDEHRTEHNGFVGIVLDCKSVDNYLDIIETANNLIGWYTGYVDLRLKTKTGYIPYRFNNLNGQFLCNDKKGEYELNEFLKSAPNLLCFSIIAEAKFSTIYHQKPNEVFYHVTDSEQVDKITQHGLAPKSLGNFTSRIYLGKKYEELIEFWEGNVNDVVVLQVDVSNVKLFNLYRDHRISTAVFTYDNIPPSQIIVKGQL